MDNLSEFRKRAYVHALKVMAYLQSHSVGSTLKQSIIAHKIMNELNNLIELAENEGTKRQIERYSMVISNLLVRWWIARKG